MAQHKAFTLIELLVVITVIVVLLALLTPALDKAIYQAELAVCGTNLSATAGSANLYAFDSKRFYPYRKLVRDYDGTVETSAIRLTIGGSGTPGADPSTLMDDRPVLHGYVQVNKMLQCPLTKKIDMEVDSAIDTWVYSTYAMFWGWTYHAQRGPTAAPQPRMNGLTAQYKLGDRFSWDGSSFNVLACDFLQSGQYGGYGFSTHPEKSGLWNTFSFQHGVNPYGTEGQEGLSVSPVSGYVTLSWWGAGGTPATVDLNYALQDGSVRRYNDVRLESTLKKIQGAGLLSVPAFVCNNFPDRSYWLPPD